METVFIKNMVCSRCNLVVNQILEELELSKYKIQLGKVDFENELSNEKKEALQRKLEKVGFELLSSEEDKIIERIKSILRIRVDTRKNLEGVQLSEFVSTEFSKNYNALSKLFSSSEGKTIERFFIELKIEKCKELIKYEKLSVSEISYELGYSSPQHLAKQFKQITGMTTSEFRKSGVRSKLDTI